MSDANFQRETLVTKQQETGQSAATQNPRLGTALWIFSGVMFCINGMCSKMLFNRNPEISALQMLTFRAIFSILFQSVWLNKSLFPIMFSVQKP